MLLFNRLVLRSVLVVVLLAAALGTAAAPLSAQPSAAPAAGAALLIGLKTGARLTAGRHGLSASSSALSASLSQLNVQTAANVFSTASGQVALAGLASPVDLRAVYRLRLPAGADAAAALKLLRDNPDVVYAEPDAVARLVTSPNDPLLPQQWGLAQIGAPGAWSVVTGSASVAIAVIDSGLDTTHPDLAGQLWTNPGEIAGNSLDDDNDGHVDDIHGWNLLNNNADLSDNNGHGTEVAGIAAAAADNGQGVAGVCWTCQLMVVKVAQPSGVANYSDIAAGVSYAAQKGAKVINLSLGGNSDSITLRAAIESAAATAVIVGGAGNDNSSALFYPAAYPDVLAVAGTDITDTKVADSNFGSWVDVTAPGEAITTTFSGGGWGASSGTSLAAPFASGLAGLLFAQHPGWSPAQVRAQIVHTADDIDAGNPSYAGQLGSGRIDAANAVSTTPDIVLDYAGYAANDQPNAPLKAGASLSLAVSLRSAWAPAGTVTASLSEGSNFVTVNQATATWGALAAGQTADNSADPFQISVLGGAFGQVIPFTLHVFAAGVASTLHFTATTESLAQPVTGHIVTNTVWTNDRVWQATGNVIVDAGITLTIQPGTVVKFNSGKALAINGTLIADGTPTQLIRFTSAADNPTPGSWGACGSGAGGLMFAQSSPSAQFDLGGNYLSGSIVRYAVIEYGCGLAANKTSPFIDHDQISNNGGFSSLYFYGDLGLNLVASANQIVSNTSGTTVMLFWGPAVLTHNLIAGNAGAGFLMQGGGVSADHNTITNNGGSSSCPDAAICMFNDFYPMTFDHNNIFGNHAAYDVGLAAGSSADSVAFDHNYWGTTDLSAIAARIYDSDDDGSAGTVIISPTLNQPEASAPVFLSQVTLAPISPVGIQTVTFHLTFSAAMDQSASPVVTFGSGGAFDAYAVTDNAAWVDATHWQATYDITSLVPRGAYTLSVSSAYGLDGSPIPTDTRFGFSVAYAGQITDQTPPSQPLVSATGANGTPSTVTGSWQATDSGSPTLQYRYAIGSAAGAVDVVNWTLVNTTSVTRTGLGLIAGRHYWFSVQAQNQGGLWSTVGGDEFVAGVTKLVTLYLPVLRR